MDTDRGETYDAPALDEPSEIALTRFTSLEATITVMTREPST